MKINGNKVILMTLIGVAIGLGCFASSLSLLTNNTVLSVTLLSLTYITGIYFVNIRNKYELIKKTR